jgi:hypothetical protein
VKNKKEIMKCIKEIQNLLIKDMNIPIESAKRINQWLSIIIQLLEKEN